MEKSGPDGGGASPKQPSALAELNQFLKEYQPLLGVLVAVMLALFSAYLSIKSELSSLKTDLARISESTKSIQTSLATRQDVKDLRNTVVQKLDGHAEAIRVMVSALKAKSIPVDEASIGRYLAKGGDRTSAWGRLIPPVVPGSPGPFRDGDELLYYAVERASVVACQAGEISRITADSLELMVSISPIAGAGVPDSPALGTLYARDNGHSLAKVELFRYQSPQMKVLVKPGDQIGRGQQIAILNGRPASVPAELRLSFVSRGRTVPLDKAIPEVHSDKGEGIFARYCLSCHYDDSTVRRVGPGLAKLRGSTLSDGRRATREEILSVIDQGVQGMPSFSRILSEEQKQSVITYLLRP
ncbi:MAG: cytochrome c [Bryobacteraceae bacterium]|nr:cytochrome c [Bryobacteraceae bacterium]